MATYQGFLEEEPNPTFGKAAGWIAIAGLIAGRQVRADGRIVIDPGDALAVAQRLLGFGVAGEGNDLDAIPFLDDLVVEGALLAADLLAAQVLHCEAVSCDYERAAAPAERAA